MISLAKYIPAGVTSRVGRQVLMSQKHSPTILFAGGVVGVVATAVMASRATLKVNQVLEQAQEDLAKIQIAVDMNTEKYTDDDRKKDLTIIYSRVAVDCFKLYGPAVLIGGLSIAALTGSHHILSKRNAGLTAAYTVLDKAFTEYRRRVTDEFGEETDHRLRHGQLTKPPVKSKLTVGTPDGPREVDILRKSPNEPSGYARFFDEFSTSWQKVPEYNLFFLRCQQNYANDLLRARGHLFLNEVYDLCGIGRSSAGSVVGWVIGKDGDNYVDFGIFDGDNPRARMFVNGYEGAVLLDFNVDGVIYDKI